MSEQPLTQEVPINIQELDGPAFRAQLVRIRNIVVPDQPVDGFDADKNSIGQGWGHA